MKLLAHTVGRIGCVAVGLGAGGEAENACVRLPNSRRFLWNKRLLINRPANSLRCLQSSKRLPRSWDACGDHELDRHAAEVDPGR